MITKDNQEPRTLESAREAAHLPPLDDNGNEIFPFTCKLCKITFRTREEWLAEDMSGEKDAALFTKVHGGHVWRRASLSCSPSRFVMCLLHMRLSFCNSLWNWVIKQSVLVKRQQVADEILHMLQKDGVNVWRLRTLTSTSEEAIRAPSFCGNAAEKIMSRFEQYMDVLECKAKDKGMRICEAMTKLIDRARLRAQSLIERQTKAIEVKKLAGDLLDTWEREVSGAKGATFYMHAAYHHLPETISNLPCDILQASGDAFEAKNQQLKKILRRQACRTCYSRWCKSYLQEDKQKAPHRRCWGKAGTSDILAGLPSSKTRAIVAMGHLASDRRHQSRLRSAIECRAQVKAGKET